MRAIAAATRPATCPIDPDARQNLRMQHGSARLHARLHHALGRERIWPRLPEVLEQKNRDPPVSQGSGSAPAIPATPPRVYDLQSGRHALLAEPNERFAETRHWM